MTGYDETVFSKVLTELYGRLEAAANEKQFVFQYLVHIYMKMFETSQYDNKLTIDNLYEPSSVTVGVFVSLLSGHNFGCFGANCSHGLFLDKFWSFNLIFLKQISRTLWKKCTTLLSH